MRKLIVIFFLVICFCASAFAQQSNPPAPPRDVWLKMTDDAVTLYQQHKNKEAIALAQKALDYAKKNFGDEHPDVAESMDNLATYLATGGEYANAEDLYKKALAIIEKNFGTESEYTAMFLNYLSDFYKKVGKNDEAKKLEERAAAIRHSAK